MDKFIDESSKGQERFPREDRIEFGSDGWLSPKGNYYKTKPDEHDESATYLTSNSDEVKTLVKQTLETWDYHRYQDLNAREKLEKLGFVLIRGEILRSEDATNFTPEQLKKITEAGIRVISAFDGAVEYPTETILQKVTSIAEGIEKADVVVNLQGHLNDLESSKVGRAYDDQFREKTMNDIKRFVRSPLKTTINDNQFWDSKGKEHEILSSGIFDYLSQGFLDEMEMDLGRSIYKFRVIDFGSCKLLVQREEYYHDGLSGGMSGDTNNYISMSVVDENSIRQKLSKLIGDRGSLYKDIPKIKTGSGGYFSEVVTDIST